MSNVREKSIVSVVWNAHESGIKSISDGSTILVEAPKAPFSEDEGGIKAQNLLLAALGSSIMYELLKEARRMRVDLREARIKVKGISNVRGKIPRFQEINVQIEAVTGRDESAKVKELLRRLERNSIVLNTIKEPTKIRVKATFEL